MKLKLRLMMVMLLLAGVLVGKLHHPSADQQDPSIASDELILGSLHLQRCEIGKRLGHNSVAAYCTLFDVPEDRAHPESRHIQIKVAVVKSDAPKPEADIAVFIDGGPGGSAINDYPAVSDAFSVLHKHHHILLVDQRGTGSSNPLDCPIAQAFGKSLLDKLGGEELDPSRIAELMKKCVDELHDKADTRFYSTTDAIADLEAIRVALDTVSSDASDKHTAVTFDVIGVSYGTRVAQQYATQYPSSVRSIVLDSPVPNTLVLGSEHAKALEDALKLQLAACSNTPQCLKKFGDAYANLHTLHQRLQQHPVTVEVRDPNTFELSQRPLSATAFAELVRLYAYNPVTSALLPLMTDDALHGNFAPLLGQVQLVTEGISDTMNSGMGLSVICTEDFDLLHAVPEDKNTLMGNSLFEFYQRACPIWPHGERPAHFHDAFRTTVPVLILSGEFDPVTPPRYAQTIAKELSSVKVLTLKGQGHAVMVTRCIPELLEKFVVRLQPASLDTTCLDSLTAISMFINYNGAAP